MADRADLLRRAVAATTEAGAAALGELFTDDVTAASPALTVGSLDELIAELKRATPCSVTCRSSSAPST